MKVFVDTDADIRLARRLERDITERGREIEGVLQQYTRFVKPAYDHYIAPAMSHADLIVPRGEQNNFLRFKYRQRTILLARQNVEYGKKRCEALNKSSS
jgi:uridine kinase